jgi:hypothetical protein
MKKILSLLIASLLVGGICFCVFRFVFGYDNATSFGISIGAVAGGLVGEWIKERWQKRKLNRVAERISE